MLESKAIDAVMVGTWPNMHKAVVVEALRQGKHVLCEARMAMDAKEAHEMWDAAKQRPYLITQVVPSPYTLAFDKTIQRLIRDNFLGSVVAIDLKSVDPKFADTTSPLTWRSDSSKSGLNIMRMGIWYEALMRWVGPATSVTAVTKVVVKQRLNPETNTMSAVEVPDHVDIIAEMACGAQARMQFSSVVGLSSPSNEVWLYGTEGTIKLDMHQQKLFAARKGDTSLAPVDIPDAEKGEWKVEEDFVNAVR